VGQLVQQTRSRTKAARTQAAPSARASSSYGSSSYSSSKESEESEDDSSFVGGGEWWNREFLQAHMQTACWRSFVLLWCSLSF